MVKEQRRGNRETKKPKKDKAAAAPASTSPFTTVDKLQAKAAQPRKK